MNKEVKANTLELFDYCYSSYQHLKLENNNIVINLYYNKDAEEAFDDQYLLDIINSEVLIYSDENTENAYKQDDLYFDTAIPLKLLISDDHDKLMFSLQALISCCQKYDVQINLFDNNIRIIPDKAYSFSEGITKKQAKGLKKLLKIKKYT